jgi:hypothetical protein
MAEDADPGGSGSQNGAPEEGLLASSRRFPSLLRGAGFGSASK